MNREQIWIKYLASAQLKQFPIKMCRLLKLKLTEIYIVVILNLPSDHQYFASLTVLGFCCYLYDRLFYFITLLFKWIFPLYIYDSLMHRCLRSILYFYNVDIFI